MLEVMEKVFEGQDCTHWPEEAKSVPVHAVQKSAEPAQVAQEDEHGIQERLSWGFTNVPAGQESTQRP